MFGQRGYNSVTIDDIAHRAGLTKGAFYYYFRSRQDVVADLQRDLWARLRANAASAYDPSADAVTNVKNTFHAFYASLRNVEEARFFLREAWTIPEVEAAARVVHKEWVGQTARFLRRAMSSGEIVRVDAEALASVLVGAFSEAALFVLTTGRIDEATVVLDRMVDSLRLINSGGSQGGRRGHRR